MSWCMAVEASGGACLMPSKPHRLLKMGETGTLASLTSFPFAFSRALGDEPAVKCWARSLCPPASNPLQSRLILLTTSEGRLLLSLWTLRKCRLGKMKSLPQESLVCAGSFTLKPAGFSSEVSPAQVKHLPLFRYQLSGKLCSGIPGD